MDYATAKLLNYFVLFTQVYPKKTRRHLCKHYLRLP